jgi:hypothetical protein
MIRLQTSLIVGLFVWLAAAQRAGAQSLQDGQLTTQTNSRKTVKAGNIGRSPNTGGIPKEPPALCFQPGMGWQRVPMAILRGPDTPGSCSSDKIGASKSATGPSPQSVYAQPNSANQGLAPEVGMTDVTTGNRAQAVTTAHSTSMNIATLSSLPGNSLASRRRGPTGVSSMPSGGTNLSSGSEPEVSADQVKDLKSHAYVSSITVRRMMRNASDLQTRIKLQELESELSNKSRVSGFSSSGNQSGKGRSKTFHVSKANSSSASDGHGRAADVAIALSSHPHP